MTGHSQAENKEIGSCLRGDGGGLGGREWKIQSQVRRGF